MADFTANLHQTLKPPFSLLDYDPNMELMTHFPALNCQIAHENLYQNFQSIMGFSNVIGDSFTNQTPDFPGKSWENSLLQPKGIVDQMSIESGASGCRGSDEKQKRKLEAMEESSSCWNSSPPVSDNGFQPKNVPGRGKRGKSGEKKSEQEKKPREVVHVRAKRGQATDSHSLAERVRRGKINEKLKCLQDMVPGCYKAMGMAVMLDEIINYVQSLQNQVEFLSMKLAAASALQDFNNHQINPTTTDVTIRKTRTDNEAQQQEMMDKLLSEGYNQHHHLQQQFQALCCFESTWPSI